MTEIRKLAPRHEEPATTAGKFLAKRGHVVMKQYREIGRVPCHYGNELVFSTLMFATAQGTRGDRTYGIKIEHVSGDGTEEQCLIDFDEVKELLLAIKHLLNTAKKSALQLIDYTEYEYITRDSLKVGFYQDTTGKQQAFFDVSPGGTLTFLGFDGIRNAFEVIKKAREHLMELGAGAEGVVSQ